MRASAPGVVVERDGDVVTLRLSNPTRRNALTRDMLLDLERAADELEADGSARVVVLRGDADGGAFSAGAELRDALALLDDDGAPTGGLLARATERIRSTSALTVAAIEGACMGGAAMLAAACDVRLADRRLRLGLTPVKLGIVFPFAGIVRLEQLVGAGAAADLLLTGRTIGLDEAVRMGLVRPIDDGETFERALGDAVRGLTALSPASVAATKAALAMAASGGRTVDDDALRAAYRRPVASGDAGEGIAAFLEKRAPRWPSASCAATIA